MKAEDWRDKLSEQVVDDLVMLVKRMVVRLRMIDDAKGNSLAGAATDYLRRKGLAGGASDLLRTTSAPPEPPSVSAPKEREE